MSDVATVNPEGVSRSAAPNTIRYVDISCVSSDGVDMAAVRTIPYGDAPSRAQRIVRSGDVILSTVRPYLRARALIESELDGAVASTGFCVLRPSSGMITPGYLNAVTSTDAFYGHLESRQTGTAYPAVRPSDVADALIRVPPIPTQRRIEDLLAAIDREIDARVQVARAGELYLRVYRDQALAANHEWVALGDLLKKIEVGVSPRCLDRLPTPGEWGVLKVSAVRPTRFDRTQVKTLPEDVPPKLAAQLRPGDLLMTRSNTIDRVGAACIAAGELDRLLLSDLIFRLSVDEDSISPPFLAHALCSRMLREQIEAAAVGTSGSMQKINQGIIRGLRVPLCPLDEQRATLRTLDAIGLAVATTSDAVHALRGFKQAALTRLVDGTHVMPEEYDQFLDERARRAATRALTG